ncbi:pimeloyl-ACP methyl ester carboxylesterase [Flavobacterium sp. 270]|uniref:alpha/beta fold hydrolase n=1 Tax=Flavobacterium sp. 270 TaxID=2512114 RepID=UPI0010666FC4|nr:alpha/beta hydrolase [Flavobacterium sp. 270]TDW48143.1 pimeloyl-ACP methyl ester carboxylesterase [Flavobacterium sp. 270]
MEIAHINKIELCYDIIGEENNNTIVLISGLGTQMIRWSIPFCELLAQKGFRVIRFDNRDSGCSTFFSNQKVPDLKELQDLLQSGKSINAPYTLFDMVDDLIGLMDFLSIDKAHFIGRSMGGIIAQLAAGKYPERVMTLTSIMSTSLNPNLPAAHEDVMQMMLSPKPDPNFNKTVFIEQAITFLKRISGSRFSFNEDDQIAIIEEEIVRSKGQNGLLRQLIAIITTGYKKERLEKIKVPTLVIHGSEDPVFLPECGKDTADSVADAKYMLIEGMGHEIPAELFLSMTDAIGEHCKK